MPAPTDHHRDLWSGASGSDGTVGAGPEAASLLSSEPGRTHGVGSAFFQSPVIRRIRYGSGGFAPLWICDVVT